jgi:hypothetical protein
MHITSTTREFDFLFCNYMDKMAPWALEHAALVSGDDDAREAGRAAAVQLCHAGHTLAGSMRRRQPLARAL